MIEVRVPATSANVGPGFDCMGLAVTAYASFRFSETGDGLCITGCPKQWQNEQNLVYQACVQVFSKCGKEISDLTIEIDAHEVPEARGLGSSAVCIVGGIVGANALLGNPLSKEEMLALCTEMEGHPDNVAPALYGGLTISFCEGEKVFTVKNQVHERFVFCALIPDYPVLTADARSVLPKQVSFHDALYNIGRCAVLAKGLSDGDIELVSHACDDVLHQPYRKVLIPDYEEVDRLADKHQALTWYISGSGSTMMLIFDHKEKAEALIQETLQRKPHWQAKLLRVDNDGATVNEALSVKENTHG